MLDTERTLRGALAGALATVVMSALMIVGMVTGLAPMPEPIPKALAALVLGSAPQPAIMATAIVGHLGYGAVWGGLLFGSRDEVDLTAGLLLGVGLWVLMGLAALPLLGWGLFGTAITPRVAVATLVLHLVYGATLAPAYEALASTAQPASEPPAGA
jgi:hypothetical protein